MDCPNFWTFWIKTLMKITNHKQLKYVEWLLKTEESIKNLFKEDVLKC